MAWKAVIPLCYIPLVLLVLDQQHANGDHRIPPTCLFLRLYPARRGYCDKPEQMQILGGCNDVYKRLPANTKCNDRLVYYLYASSRLASRGFIYTDSNGVWVLGTSRCGENKGGAILQYNYPCGERTEHCMMNPWDKRWDTGLVVTCETCEWVRLHEFMVEPLASNWYRRNGTCTMLYNSGYDYPHTLYHTMPDENRLYLYYQPQFRHWVVSRKRCSLKVDSITNSLVTLDEAFFAPWPHHVRIYCVGTGVMWDPDSKILYTTNKPWQHLPAPQPRATIQPIAKFYTRQWVKHPVLLDFARVQTNGMETALERFLSARGGLSTKVKTTFIVHGMGDNVHGKWQDEMARGIIKKMLVANVAVIGWGDGAPSHNYPLGATNTRIVADYISIMIIALMNAGSTASSFWCIGHDMGAHACGLAGQRVKQETGLDIFRVTGLDPSGPLFETHDPETRLSPDDAEYVDVIHTQGRITEGGMPAMGTMKPLGDDDFYPEAGSSTRELAIDLMVSSLIQPMKCMFVHHMCHDAWRIPQSCQAVGADMSILMGYYSAYNRDAAGNRRMLYTDVANEDPFCTINRQL